MLLPVFMSQYTHIAVKARTRDTGGVLILSRLELRDKVENSELPLGARKLCLGY